MKRSLKEWIVRSIILLAGLTIAHLGVTLFYLANLGVDPFNVLVQGVYNVLFGMTGWAFLTVGRVHMGICFLIILVLLAVDKSYVKIGTVICMAFGGPIIDFFTMILQPLLPESLPLWGGILMLAAGCVILAYGMTVVIKSDAGTGPNDLVAVVISDKSGKKFSIVRTVTDVSFVVIGFVLGGVFGLGTIICACFVGTVAGYFLPINEKIINKIVG